MTEAKQWDMITAAVRKHMGEDGVHLLATLLGREKNKHAKAERDSILSLVRTWCGNTVEGRDLIEVIEMRGQR